MNAPEAAYGPGPDLSPGGGQRGGGNRHGRGPRRPGVRARRKKGQEGLFIHRRSWVLGTDTMVVVENLILGKPGDAADTGAMLIRLGGRTHQVINPQLPQLPIEIDLVFHIQGAGGLVQDGEPTAVDQQAGKGQPLLLA